MFAYERQSDTKTRGDSLDVFIDNLTKTYSTQLSVRNAEDELKFNKMVMENGLSLADQLTYRQDQLKRVADDPAEKKRIKTEIASLKQRIEQENFANEYLEQLTNYQTGVSSIDNVISYLETQKTSQSDPTVLSTIEKNLSDAKQKKFELTKQALQNQTDYALKDKTDSVLDEQIGRVSSAKSAALLSGNNTLVTMYDLQLQSLQQTKAANAIQKDITNFAVSASSGYASATGLLDSYNSKILSADPNTPIKIGDVTYASVKEFWTYKRDSYISDTSSNGFFASFNNEQNMKIKIADSKNQLSTDVVSSSGREYDNLLARPELQNYATAVTNYKQDTLQTGGNLLASSIMNTYSTTYDVNKAIAELNQVKSLGVNVQDTFTKILTSAASIKNTQVNNILTAAQTALTNDPNLTPEQALLNAIKAGAGAILSPEQLVNKNETELATDLSKGAQGNQFGNDPRVSTKTTNNVPSITQPNTQGPQPTVPNQPTPSILINKQLDFGATDSQVKELQKFLNKAGFSVAAQGQAGSAGMETDYFGPSTQAALKRFQQANGIVSGGDAATTGYGRLGPQTLAKIQSYKF